ncbi:MAG: repressor LexA [Chloroflexota bacterium]
MPAELSPRQRRVLDFIRRYIAEHGYPPTIREICEACNISSTSVANYNLRRLAEAGYIRRSDRLSRAIELTEAAGEAGLTGRAGLFPFRLRLTAAAETVQVPLLGRIAAGSPIPVPTENVHPDPDIDTVSVPAEIIGNRQNVYALKVQGQSMVDALIDDGDIVIVQHTRTAENGEMVVAWLPDRKETTLKRFYLEGDRVRLQPANSQMEPIILPAGQVEIQGRVIAVLRKLA